MSIELKNVSFTYKDKPILNGINLNIQEGKPIAVTGMSGCGKSTLLHIIAGLKTPTSGTITGLSDAGCAMVFQEDRLLENLTVLENLRFVCKNITREHAEHMLKQVGLENITGLYPTSLSGGMKRRVAVVRAIAFNRSPIIMDEPFNGLDKETKEKVMCLIKKNISDKIFLFVTHDQGDADYFNAQKIELT